MGVNTGGKRAVKMILQKTIWLFGLLLVIAALSLTSTVAQAQEETRVTMGPWRALTLLGLP